MGTNQSKIYNQQVPNSRIQGFTPVYRKKDNKVLKQTPNQKIRTLAQMFKNTEALYGKSNGIGEIKVQTIKDANGKDIDSRTIINHTYSDVYNQSISLGKSLYTRKMYFQQPIRKMKLIGIYSRNRYEWFITDWACVIFGLTSVPLYDTLGVENISYCLNQTQLQTLFVSSLTVNTLLTLKDFGKLKTLISYDQLQQNVVQKIKAAKLQLVYYSDLITNGAKIEYDHNEIKQSYDDIYTFSYTSGTTGPPKGVLLSHGNFLACISSFTSHQDIKVCSNDVYVSYLPLPHVMQRCLALAIFYIGAYLIVSCGNTLKLKDDMCFAKPTILVSVPRIFNRIVESVKAKFSQSTGVAKYLIDWGVNKKLNSAKTDGTFTNRFYDPLVFSKVRESFGGRIRLLASGSAPINPEVLAFMKAIMCCPYIQGYGQTEDTAAVLFGRAYDTEYGTLCQLGAAAQIKLADIPQMKYSSKDVDQNGNQCPRGQILIRGPQVFKGYYKLEQLTKQTITADGWLRTGDIAQLIPQRCAFKIIDRKKNIFKLQQGQYVAPDKVQNIYLDSGLISEGFLHGQSSQNFAVAVMVPIKQKIMKIGQEIDIKGTYQELCERKQIRIYILTELNKKGKKQGLYGFELAKNIYLQRDGFLAKNILTNTMKLMRFDARQAYKNEIQKMYAEGELPIKI